MTPIAEMVALMLSKGIDHETIVLAIQTAEIAASGGKSGGIPLESPVDTTAEKRRAYDRKRKNEARESARLAREAAALSADVSGGSPVDTADPLSPPSSPKEVSPYNPLQEITPPSSSIPGARVRASDFPPDAFEQFWARVPRREGKAAAKRKFDQIRKAGSVPFAKLLTGIERYAAAMRSVEPQFVKHPATWLNAGCWDDEIAPRTTGPPKHAGPQGFESLFTQPGFSDHGSEHRPDFDLDLTANRTD
jgi:hypothetical protein